PEIFDTGRIEAAETASAAPAVVVECAGIRDVDEMVRTHGEVPWLAESEPVVVFVGEHRAPHSDHLPGVQIQDLDPPVAAVGDIESAVRTEHQPARLQQLSRAATRL